MDLETNLSEKKKGFNNKFDIASNGVGWESSIVETSQAIKQEF